MTTPLRTRLDLLKPSVQEHVSNKQLEQKKHHDVCSTDPLFQMGQPVLVWNFQDTVASPEISPGTSIPISEASSEKLDDLLEGCEETGMEGCGV